MGRHIKIGTRGSDLALWQAYTTKSKLEALGATVDIKIITTKGDRIQDLSFDKIEGKGFFTKEIEDTLLNGEVDLAVHSHKDLETQQPEGLTIAAVSERANAADILIISKNKFDASLKFGIKPESIIGTSSFRRKALLSHHLTDINITDLRGNVPTRIEKLRQGNYDAIVLAKAGVDRLQIDLSEFEVVVLPPKEFVPAPAQGVLGWQVRSHDNELIEFIQALNSPLVQECIHIERTILSQMEGGCHLPLGVYVTKSNDNFTVYVAYAETAESQLLHFKKEGNNADILIQEIVSLLKKKSTTKAY